MGGGRFLDDPQDVHPGLRTRQTGVQQVDHVYAGFGQFQGQREQDFQHPAGTTIPSGRCLGELTGKRLGMRNRSGTEGLVVELERHFHYPGRRVWPAQEDV